MEVLETGGMQEGQLAEDRGWRGMHGVEERGGKEEDETGITACCLCVSSTWLSSPPPSVKQSLGTSWPFCAACSAELQRPAMIPADGLRKN